MEMMSKIKLIMYKVVWHKQGAGMKAKGQSQLNMRLRLQRQLRGWSLQRVVDEICALSETEGRIPGINAAMVSNWERGVKKPSPFYQERLCKLFGMSADQLGLIDVPLPLLSDRSQSISSHSMSLYDIWQTPMIHQDDRISFVSTQEFAKLEPGNTHLAYLSRRAALTQLLNALGTTILPHLDVDLWDQLSLARTRPAMMNAKAFSHFQKIVAECWELCNTGEMQIAEQILTSFLPEMTQPASYYSEAAILVAQGLRLQSILRGHQLKFDEMAMLCQQAVAYARQANDPDTLSATLNGLAVAYKYAQQPQASCGAYQEALDCADQASPLLRSRVYAGAAATFAQRGRKQEAFFYMGLAYENFPEHPEADPNFLSADNGIYMLAYYKGLLFLALGQPREAEEAFESYKDHLAGYAVPERNRLEIINHLGRAAIMSGNLDKYIEYLRDGVSGAIILQSKKRWDEAVTIYHQEMPKSWLHEAGIRQIDEQFQLTRNKQVEKQGR